MQSQLTRFKLTGRRGFALVITLSLMILLTILAVGLLSLASIELRTSSVGKNQAVARANAMLALNIALGELQKAAGPDQRVTARADILGLKSDSPSGLTEPSKSKWTGVWNTDPTLPLSEQQKATWLVSSRNTPDSAGGPIVETASNIKLVGTGSAGGDDLDKVVVELLDLKDPNNKVTGRYGWWVGDEGIKARVNLKDPNYSFTGMADIAEVRKRALYPANGNLKSISELAAFSLNKATNDNLVKAISRSQLDLLAPAIAGDPRKSAFHDVTTMSSGVLSNVRDGGLKRDLSRVLYDSTSETGPVFTFPDKSKGVSWEMLRSYAQAIAPADGSRVPEIIVRPHRVGSIPAGTDEYRSNPFGSDDQHGFSPIISRFSWELFPGLDPAGTDPANPSLPLYKLQVSMRVNFVLANPYNVRLVAPSDYRVSFNFARDGFNGVDWRIGVKEDSNPIQYRLPWSQLCSNFTPAEVTSSLNANNPWWHFLVPKLVLEPGEAVVFSIDESASTYPDFMPITLMKRGYSPTNRVIFQIGSSPGGNPVANRDQIAGGNYAIGDAGHPDILSGRFPKGGGRNPTISLHLSKGETAQALASNLGEPLARIERLSHIVFKRDNGYFWRNMASGAISTNAFTGGDISMINNSSGSGRNGYQDNNRINFARNSNLRFPFAPDIAGAPFPKEGGDARRSVFPYHNGWVHTATTTYPLIGTNALWGPNDNFSHPTSGPGQKFVSLFEVLTQPLVSIGQLQHANWFGQDRPLRPDNQADLRGGSGPAINDGNGIARNISRPFQAGMAQPGYGVGNAYRDPAAGKDDISYGADAESKTYDGLALANRAMWDKYFVSTIPNASQFPTADQKLLVNQRMKLIDKDGGPPERDDLLDAGKAAANLMVEGAFNINSTSVNAWKAFLSGLNGTSYVIAPSVGSVTIENNVVNPFSRLSQPNAQSGTTASSTADKRWQSAISLTDDQIDDLASGIVQRIINRSKDVSKKMPFVSLEQFINRVPTSSPTTESLGLLQEALEQTKLPDGSNLKGDALNGNFLSDYEFGKNGTGSISQGDLLQALGPFISNRSDTFTIRAYGEARDAAGLKITGRAWCEVTVQRTTGFVDPSDAPSTAITSVNATNKEFGRRFVITSFRWLQSNEI